MNRVSEVTERRVHALRKGVPSAVVWTVRRWCLDCAAGPEESSTSEVQRLWKFCHRNCWMFVAPRKSERQLTAESAEWYRTRGCNHLPSREAPARTATGELHGVWGVAVKLRAWYWYLAKGGRFGHAPATTLLKRKMFSNNINLGNGWGHNGWGLEIVSICLHLSSGKLVTRGPGEWSSVQSGKSPNTVIVHRTIIHWRFRTAAE